MAFTAKTSPLRWTLLQRAACLHAQFHASAWHVVAWLAFSCSTGWPGMSRCNSDKPVSASSGPVPATHDLPGLLTRVGGWAGLRNRVAAGAVGGITTRITGQTRAGESCQASAPAGLAVSPTTRRPGHPSIRTSGAGFFAHRSAVPLEGIPYALFLLIINHRKHAIKEKSN